MSTFTPILALDFDGVIHDYQHGWQDGVIYGELTPGFIEWAAEAKKLFKLVVYSSRSKDPEKLEAMRVWMADKLGSAASVDGALNVTILDFEFAHEKPPAWLTIDDRCIRFEGSWDEPKLHPSEMLQFKPWMQR